MSRSRLAAACAVLLLSCLPACSTTVAGTATWPGATLERVLLTQRDFPAGVDYVRITDKPDTPDGAGAPPPMLTEPPGCSNALTDVIAKSAERGPGSAASYQVSYDGARILMTALSWNLDLDALAATAAKCDHFETYFDAQSPGIPMTTVRLDSPGGELRYQQTMELSGESSSIYMSFANVGHMGVFALVFPTENPSIGVKATLPQTFTDVVDRQITRIRGS